MLGATDSGAGLPALGPSGTHERAQKNRKDRAGAGTPSRPGRDCGARAGRGGAALSRRAERRAARRGRGARRPGVGARRRRHRQDPRAHDAHRPHPEPRPRAPRGDSRGDLHQQGRARDEGPHRQTARPHGRGHAVARHVPRHLRKNPAAACRARRAQTGFHYPRRRRSDPPHQADPAGREHRREALAGAAARQHDRQLEEPRAHARPGAGGRSPELRRRPGSEALRRPSGAAESAQRGGFRRSPARVDPAVPRERGRAGAIPGALQIHAGRRISGHERRAISLAAPARPGLEEPVLRRRRRSIDLRLARRGGRQHPALREGFSRREDRPARVQLPLDRAHSRRRLASDRPQRGPARQDAAHRRAFGREGQRDRRLGFRGGGALDR